MLLRVGKGEGSEVTQRSAEAQDLPRPGPGAVRGEALSIELRVVEPSRHWSSSAMGMVTSVPWCCILPAALASLGLASSMLAHWLGALTPALLGASVVLFGRAHYLLWVKRHGSRSARWVTVVLTLLAASFWMLRLSPRVLTLLPGW